MDTREREVESETRSRVSRLSQESRVEPKEAIMQEQCIPSVKHTESFLGNKITSDFNWRKLACRISCLTAKLYAHFHHVCGLGLHGLEENAAGTYEYISEHSRHSANQKVFEVSDDGVGRYSSCQSLS